MTGLGCTGSCDSCANASLGNYKGIGVGIGMLTPRNKANPNVYDLPFSGGSLAGLGDTTGLGWGGLIGVIAALWAISAYSDLSRYTK